MEGPARTRLIALAVLLAVSAPLVIVAASGSGGGAEETETGLRVERSPELPELLVYVSPEVNLPERARRQTVTVECIGADGEVLGTQTERWPFSDTDQGTLDPHAHIAVNPARIGEVERCRLRGTDPELEAPVA